MNYCDKIHYTLYTATEGTFEEMVEELLADLPAGEKLLRLTFFGMPEGNEQFVKRREFLLRRVTHYTKGEMPVISYVCQPPLSGKLIMEVHSYRPDETDMLHYRRYQHIPYVILENPAGRFLFAGGFHGDVVNETILQQSDAIFELINGLLKLEHFPVNSIIRQWNYIERITAFEGVDQHYQMFNNSRSDFYNQTSWENGFPAATGIGADWGGVCVDLDAAVFTDSACFATPIDNKLQVAAHAYSEEVLEAAQHKKSTPKFERAKSMTFEGRTLVYISGTAAIRGEESLRDVTTGQQLHITMENIAQLTGKAELKMLRVYLKEAADYAEIASLLEAYGLNIPVSYMCADVCRDELLIEIEGIAID